MIWNREPVAIVNAVRLVVLAAVSFGLDFTETQIVTSMVALEAVLTLFTRSKVTPVADAFVRFPAGDTWLNHAVDIGRGVRIEDDLYGNRRDADEGQGGIWTVVGVLVCIVLLMVIFGAR